MPDNLAISEFLSTVFAPAIEDATDAFFVVSYFDPIHSQWWSKSFPIEAYDAGAEWLSRHAESSNTYYRVNLLARQLHSGRGKFRDNGWVTHFVCDVDYGKAGHSKTNLAPDLETACEVIMQTLPPSLLVHSGGGVYGIYLLDEPYDVRALNANLHAKNIGQRLDAALAKLGEPDRINNGAHVIRPVGSLNHKRGTPFRVEIIDGGDMHRYTIEGLDANLAPLTKELAEVQSQGEWRPTKVGKHFNSDPKNSWSAILEADEKLSWHDNGDDSWFCEGSTTKKSATIKDGRFYVHSDTVAQRLNVAGGARLDKFGLAARLLNEHPKELTRKLLL